MKPVRENITCKKCLAAYDKEFNTVVETVEEEMSLKEYKEKGIAWIIKK